MLQQAETNEVDIVEASVTIGIQQSLFSQRADMFDGCPSQLDEHIDWHGLAHVVRLPTTGDCATAATARADHVWKDAIRAVVRCDGGKKRR